MMSKIEDGSVNFEHPVDVKNESERNKTRNGGGWCIQMLIIYFKNH